MKGTVTPVTETNGSTRMDSWASALTGLGSALRDKTRSFLYRRTVRRNLEDDALEDLYAKDDMAAVIVDTLPEQMFRAGFQLIVQAEEESDGIRIGNEVVSAIEEAGMLHAEFRAMVLSRIFGGAAAYHLIDDGRRQDQPVNIEGVRQILGAHILDSRELRPRTYYQDPMDPKFGMPELYELYPTSRGNAIRSEVIRIHESRISAYHGIVTTRRRMDQDFNNGWGESVLERSYETLQSFHQAWAATSNLMADSAQGVFKMHGLIQAVASGNKELLQQRMEIVDRSRSVARAIMLDAEMEDFSRQPHNLSGLDKLLQQFAIRLSASARLPATLMFRQSPAGLNATGESDIRLFHEEVESMQQKVLKPKLLRLVELMLHNQTGPTAGQIPEEWDIEFSPLRQMSELEQAELRNKQAQTDRIYIQDGVIIPEEVSISRFGASGWSPETVIDLDLREQTLDAAKEKELEMAENPPQPPPGPSGQLPPGVDDADSDPEEQPQTELIEPDSGDDEEPEGRAGQDEDDE